MIITFFKIYRFIEGKYTLNKEQKTHRKLERNNKKQNPAI